MTGREALAWFDVVREYFPGVNNEIADLILFEHTAFPLVGEAEIRQQLEEFAEKRRLMCNG